MTPLPAGPAVTPSAAVRAHEQAGAPGASIARARRDRRVAAAVEAGWLLGLVAAARTQVGSRRG
jgi:hypothetical protein